MLGLLIVYANSLGYGLTLGRGYVSHEANQVEGGHERSLHLIRLAQDLNLFDADNNYLTETDDHRFLGQYWEQMGGSWGGHWGDGNHYSYPHGGMK